MNNIEEFLRNINGQDIWSDGYIEVVTDYTSAKYFNEEQISGALIYASEMTQSGHEVHFGPALRKENLGSKRSDKNNILWAKCLWVDIDSPDKNLPAEEKLEQAEILKDNFIEALKSYGIKPSYIVCSGHGFHIYIVLQRIQPALENWPIMQGALINLAKGDQQAKDVTRLLRFPGTFNFKDRSNPKNVEIIFESGSVYHEDAFIQLIKDHGKKCITTNVNVTPVETKPLGFIPPCIAHLLDTNTKVELGHRHQVRLIMATFGFHEGWTATDVIGKVAHLTDAPNKSADDINAVFKSLQQDSNKYNVGCGEGSTLKALVDSSITICDKNKCQFGKAPTQKPAGEDKTEIIKTADFPGLVDLVLNDKGDIVFLVKENNNLTIKYEQMVDGKKFIPPPKDKVLWMIPKSSTVMQHYLSDTDAVLFIDLVNYLKTISKLPDDNHYLFLAAFLMHTYLVDKFEYSPMIWFYAIPERGKTRTGKAMTYSAFRGVQIVTLREAHMIRLTTDLRATLFIDVTDLQQKADANGVEDILLNRYEKGARIARVLYPDKGAFDDTVYYDIYGATIAATNETVNDVLATRTVQIIMPESDRQFNDDVKEVNGLPFRERLLGFRARWMDKDIPVVIKPCNGRLGDILRCIRQIVNIVSSDEKWFLDFVTGIEKQRKLSGADGLDAQVVNAIKDSLNAMKQGHIFHEDILRNLNINKSEKEKISPNKLGKITSRLGFEKYTSGQQRGIYWNADLFKRLCERYGIEYVDNTF